MPMVLESRSDSNYLSWPSLAWTFSYPGGSTTHNVGGTPIPGNWGTSRLEAQLGFRSHGSDFRNPEKWLDEHGSSARRANQSELLEKFAIIASMTTQSPRGNFSQGRPNHHREYSLSEWVANVGIIDAFTDRHPTSLGRQNSSGPVGVIVYPHPTVQALVNSSYLAAEQDYDEASAASRLRNARPTKPHAGLAQFVGELGDLPRTLNSFASARASMGDVSDKYVASQFGVIPTVSDIQRMADAVLHSHKYIADFAMHAGRRLRRARAWSTQGNVQRLNKGVFSLAADGSMERSIANGPLYGRALSWNTNGSLKPPGIRFETTGSITTTVDHKVWATFEYFLADPDGFLGRVFQYQQKAQYLLGTQLNLSTVWELTPWSWLVDWTADVGGLIAYQESVASDSLVMTGSGYRCNYSSFAMVAANATSSTNANGTTFASGSATGMYQRRGQKRIRGVSPYSLNLNPSLTGRQIAILGALGITRAPGVL